MSTATETQTGDTQSKVVTGTANEKKHEEPNLTVVELKTLNDKLKKDVEEAQV